MSYCLILDIWHRLICSTVFGVPTFFLSLHVISITINKSSKVDNKRRVHSLFLKTMVFGNPPGRGEEAAKWRCPPSTAELVDSGNKPVIIFDCDMSQDPRIFWVSCVNPILSKSQLTYMVKSGNGRSARTKMDFQGICHKVKRRLFIDWKYYLFLPWLYIIKGWLNLRRKPARSLNPFYLAIEVGEKKTNLLF